MQVPIAPVAKIVKVSVQGQDVSKAVRFGAKASLCEDRKGTRMEPSWESGGWRYGGGLPARNDKGGACLRTLRGDADSHAHAALMSNL